MSLSNENDTVKLLARAIAASASLEERDDPESIAMAIEHWIRRDRNKDHVQGPAAFVLAVLGEKIWARAAKIHANPTSVDDLFYRVIYHAVGSMRNSAPKTVLSWLIAASEHLEESSRDMDDKAWKRGADLRTLGRVFCGDVPFLPDATFVARAREKSSPLDGRRRRRFLSESNANQFIQLRINPAQVELNQ